jgi:hypothetical protein
MNSNDEHASKPSGTAGAENADLKPEVVVIPVSDIDRAKQFHGRTRTLGAQFQPDGADGRVSGPADGNWPGWYAAYMVAEQAGAGLPS